MQIPEIALSIRQPWAWAIVAGHKDVENRSTFAITKGEMRPRRIAIHAANGMTRDEYEEAAEFMAGLGVRCPRPDALIRGAIIGAATVTAVVAQCTGSRWFFGPRGLLLADAVAFDPIPARGALGYFRWTPAQEIDKTKPWMVAWGKVEALQGPRCAAAPLFQ